MSRTCTPQSRRCEFWTEGGYIRPPCCTAHLKELLVFTHTLLERHHIPHWLDFGALLGAARTGEFIPWDSDVDFGILQADLERLRALKGEIEEAGHQLDARDPLVWRINLSAINTQHADIYPWREEDGTLKMRWPGYAEDAWSFPRRYLDAAEPVTLYGLPFPAPVPLHEFLARYRYGPDYLTPRRPEEQTRRERILPIVRAFVEERRRP